MERAELEGLIAEGLTTRGIAERLGCSQTNVRHWLAKFELRTRRGRASDLPIEDRPYRCRKCGETDPTLFYLRHRFTCKACQDAATTARAKEHRRRAVALLGGACSRCGITLECVLDFHHLDPAEKDPGYRSLRCWGWKRIVAELAKCVLLCKNCHAIEHCVIADHDHEGVRP